jgi:PAS domain S-box-containing protein
MTDFRKTKEQLAKEVTALRQRVAELEAAPQPPDNSEAWARQLLDAAPLGIHLCNTEGRITFVNSAQEVITGYSADELLGTYVWDRMEPGPEKEAAPALLKSLAAEQPAPAPLFFRDTRKNGEVFDIRVDWNCTRDSQGQVTGFVSVISDVTEQKCMERELRKSRAILQAIVDCLPFDFFALGSDGRYILQNAASKETWGDATGKTPGEICKDPEMLAEWLDNNHRAYAGKKFEKETTFTLRGEERSCIAVLAPIEDEGETYGILGVNVDITKRKQAEEALRQSEERYRMLTESTTDMIYIMNRAGDVLYANRSAAAGINFDAPSLVGKRQNELFSPEKVQKHTQSIASVFETGKVYETDGMYHFGSEDVWLNTRLMPLRNERGEVTAVMGVSRNITARRRAEAALKQAHHELERRVEERTAELEEANKALRQSEEKYRGLVEASPDAVIIADIKGGILFASHRTKEFLGLSDQDELVGRSVFDFVIDEDRPRLAANVPDLMKTGIRRNTEYTARRKDGTTFPVEISSARGPNTEQQPWAILAVVRDISERRQAQEALHQSEEKYRGLVEISPDSIVVSDLTGNVLFVSNQAWRLLGVPAQEELLGKNTLDYVVETDRPRLAANLAELIKVGSRGYTEYTALRSDGTTVPVELSSAVIRDARRRPIAAMAIIRDISERKQAEEALKKEHRTLKRLLQSSDRERQLIAYEIHDGLAQQLAGAIMQIETYWHQKEAKPKEATKAYEAALTMLRQAHFETRRLISGVRPPILDESGVVAAVAHLVNEQTLENGPKIEFHGDVSFGRLVPILENAIYRIVQEGLANACKYSQSDTVRVELVQCGDVLRIRVQDWGIGFDPAAAREDHFGLEGIRERARLLGGNTTIESRQKRGTSMSVELPLVLREE